MVTLFSISKPFRDHIRVIQENALQSWTRLSPLSKAGIILMSDFIKAVERIVQWVVSFLMVGRRWETYFELIFDFGQSD
jgi:hypothetical protein